MFHLGSSHGDAFNVHYFPRWELSSQVQLWEGSMPWPWEAQVGFCRCPSCTNPSSPTANGLLPSQHCQDISGKEQGTCWRGKWGSSILTASLLNCYFILSPTEKNADIISSSQKRTEKDCVSARKPDLK